MSSLLSGSPRVLAAKGKHGDGPVLRHAGHEVVEARVAPELDLLDREAADRCRVVERDGVTLDQPAAHGRTLGQRRWVAAAESRGPHRSEVRRHFVFEQERHPIDQQRFHDARHQPLGEPVQVEVAVEIARKPQQRAAVVVSIAIERAVEHVLHERLDRRRQEHGDQRRQKREHPLVGVVPSQEHAPHGLEKHGVNHHHRRQRRGEHQRALDDDLDVEQSIADDRRRVRQRNQTERNDRELHRQRRLDAERVRQRVADRERAGAERRAPGDPSQLPPRGNRADL